MIARKNRFGRINKCRPRKKLGEKQIEYMTTAASKASEKRPLFDAVFEEHEPECNVQCSDYYGSSVIE